jgi:hypothetical protein
MIEEQTRISPSPRSFSRPALILTTDHCSLTTVSPAHNGPMIRLHAREQGRLAGSLTRRLADLPSHSSAPPPPSIRRPGVLLTTDHCSLSFCSLVPLFPAFLLPTPYSLSFRSLVPSFPCSLPFPTPPMHSKNGLWNCETAHVSNLNRINPIHAPRRKLTETQKL